MQLLHELDALKRKIQPNTNCHALSTGGLLGALRVVAYVVYHVVPQTQWMLPHIEIRVR